MMKANRFRLFSTWIRNSAVARFVFWTGISIIIWTFSSKAVQDILVYGAFLFALAKFSRGADAWKQPAGIAFIIVLIHMIVTLPFSVCPSISVRDFGRLVEVLAGAFAIPVIFNTRTRIKAALFYSAVAIALTLSYDMVRLYWHLGSDLLAKAHAFQPFILNHSNVASMMGGASAFIFFYFFWIWRQRFWQALGCLAGIAICLSYQIIIASRGPQLAFAIACCFVGFLMPGWRKKLLWVLCVAVIGGLLITNVRHVNPRFMEKATMANFSDRDKVWTHTWELTRQRPWLGYGYGKRNFESVYYSSNPPKAAFFFPHTHQFWLKLLFEFGWTGFALHLAAWLILAVQLARYTFSKTTFQQRLLPGTVGLILLFIHSYGLGDYPDNIVRVAQIWLIPVALVLMKKNTLPPQRAGNDNNLSKKNP